MAEEMTSLCLSESRILARWDATESAYWVMWTCEDNVPEAWRPGSFKAHFYGNRRYLQGGIQAVVLLGRRSFGGGGELVRHHAPPAGGAKVRHRRGHAKISSADAASGPHRSSILVVALSSFSRICSSCASSSQRPPQPSTRARSFPVPSGSTPSWHCPETDTPSASPSPPTPPLLPSPACGG